MHRMCTLALKMTMNNVSTSNGLKFNQSMSRQGSRSIANPMRKYKVESMQH